MILQKIVIILRSKDCMHYTETRVVFTTRALNLQKRTSTSAFLLETKSTIINALHMDTVCLVLKKSMFLCVSSGKNLGFGKET